VLTTCFLTNSPSSGQSRPCALSHSMPYYGSDHLPIPLPLDRLGSHRWRMTRIDRASQLSYATQVPKIYVSLSKPRFLSGTLPSDAQEIILLVNCSTSQYVVNSSLCLWHTRGCYRVDFHFPNVRRLVLSIRLFKTQKENTSTAPKTGTTMYGKF